MRDRRAPRFLRLERRYFNFDELLYRLLPAFDSGEDAVWVGGPDEEFGIGVCLSDKAVDSDLEVNDGSEHAALEATARELGEEAFDRMEPGCGGRGEVERPAGMPGQPLAHLRMLVGRIVVDDGVDHLPGRDLLRSGRGSRTSSNTSHQIPERVNEADKVNVHPVCDVLLVASQIRLMKPSQSRTTAMQRS